MLKWERIFEWNVFIAALWERYEIVFSVFVYRGTIINII
jgi:hypothetical protein